MTRLDHEIQLASLRAQWWIASATTGHCLSRKIYRGLGCDPSTEITDSEKINEAMNTANGHIRRATELIDQIKNQ